VASSSTMMTLYIAKIILAQSREKHRNAFATKKIDIPNRLFIIEKRTGGAAERGSNSAFAIDPNVFKNMDNETELSEGRPLPKSFLWTTLITLALGIVAEIVLLLLSPSSPHDLAYLPPLVFLILFSLGFLALLLLAFLKKTFLARFVCFLIAPRSLLKDLLAFCWEQLLVFAFVWGILSQLVKAGGQSGDPYALAFLFAAILLGLVTLYPLFWGMEEREENSPMLFEKTSRGTLITYRVLTLAFSLALASFLIVLLVLNLDGASVGEKIALFVGSVLFLVLAIAGLILLKKGGFEKAFAFFVYESNQAKAIFLILTALFFALSLYAPFLFSSTITLAAFLPYVPLYIFDGLFVLFGALPLLFLRYPYPKSRSKE
jgi:hypothetical protein